MNSRRPAVAGLLIVLLLWLALALRCHALDGQSLWADEGNSVALARAGLAEIAARTAQDIHPPLYYWLLHGWMRVFGATEVAVRSLSAFADVLLVAVVMRLARRLFSRQGAWVAGLATAVSPFQVYYAQEARMYALLALLAGLSVWAVVEMLRPGRPSARWPSLFIISATLGLYTHYAFPVILAATGLAWPVALRRGDAIRRVLWLVCHGLPVVAFLPWLPTAWRQLTTWPAPAPADLPHVLATLWRTLVAGPAGVAQPPLWLVLPGLLGLVGLARLAWGASRAGHRRFPPAAALLVLLYLGFPAALTAALFKPAYLKFLVVASPAWCLLLAATLASARTPRRSHRMVATAAALLGSLVVVLAARGPIVAYFTDPALARDDYRGLARYLQAVGRADDAVVLNAPGQQEVFGYYYRGAAPVYPLPRSRPADRAATLAELDAIVGRSRHIHAVYWATEESDPEGLIAGWLDEHAVPTTGWWVGNLRIALYAAPIAGGAWQDDGRRLGDHIRLDAHRVTLPGAAALPGTVVQVDLRWQSDAALPDQWVAFVQLLDAAGHVAGQRDASPLRPGDGWRAGLPVHDRHGVLIPYGTPPGDYRLIVGLYDRSTGVRLAASSADGSTADHLTLTTLRIVPPEQPPDVAALLLRHPLDLAAGPFRLLGADCFKLGHDSDPDAPLAAGDPLHVVLYWQAAQPPGEDWRLRLQLAPPGGGDAVAANEFPLAGIEYPSSQWRGGEIVRAQYDLWLPASTPPGDYLLAAHLLDPAATQPAATLRVCKIATDDSGHTSGD